MFWRQGTYEASIDACTDDYQCSFLDFKLLFCVEIDPSISQSA